MPSFPLNPIARPSRAPTPAEVYDCLAQLLPPVASPPPLDLLPMVMPLLAVLRLWNVHLRSEARRALELVPEQDKKVRKRLKALSKDKTQDALEQKLHGFGTMVGLWRVQTAILAGTTSKAELQPLIDEFYPPAPLPSYFLASDGSSLPPARRKDVESTVLRTRKTCQALRKKAALVVGAYTGPSDGLKDALLAAKISDGPIGLLPASLEGDDGTARAILSQARNIQTLWEEMTSLFPPPPQAALPSPGNPASGSAPNDVASSQGSIVEDSQKPVSQRKPARPPRPLTTAPPTSTAGATLQPDANPTQDAAPAPAQPAPAAPQAPAEPSRHAARPAAPMAQDAPRPTLSLGGPSTTARRVVLPPPLPPSTSASSVRRVSAPSASFASTPVLPQRGAFDQPPWRPSSTVAPPRTTSNPLKRAINRYSVRSAFDTDSSSDDESADVSRRAALPPPAKKARHDGTSATQAAGLAIASKIAGTSSWGSAGSKGGSQGTNNSSLGYVDLPPGATPRPRQPSPRPSSSGASRDFSGQARGEFRRN